MSWKKTKISGELEGILEFWKKKKKKKWKLPSRTDGTKVYMARPFHCRSLRQDQPLEEEEEEKQNLCKREKENTTVVKRRRGATQRKSTAPFLPSWYNPLYKSARQSYTILKVKKPFFLALLLSVFSLNKTQPPWIYARANHPLYRPKERGKKKGGWPIFFMGGLPIKRAEKS